MSSSLIQDRMFRNVSIRVKRLFLIASNIEIVPFYFGLPTWCIRQRIIVLHLINLRKYCIDASLLCTQSLGCMKFESPFSGMEIQKYVDIMIN